MVGYLYSLPLEVGSMWFALWCYRVTIRKLSLVSEESFELGFLKCWELKMMIPLEIRWKTFCVIHLWGWN